MEENKTNENKNWIADELKQAEQTGFDGVKMESLVLTENKTETVAIDITEPWKSWKDTNKDTVKKIIPVTHQGMEKIFWLNTKNPVYKELLVLAKATQENEKTTFIVKLLRTGKQENTRYVIVED